jgi:hypothetical protein
MFKLLCEMKPMTLIGSPVKKPAKNPKPIPKTVEKKRLPLYKIPTSKPPVSPTNIPKAIATIIPIMQVIFFLFMNTKTITIKDKIVTMIPVNKIDNE